MDRKVTVFIVAEYTQGERCPRECLGVHILSTKSFFTALESVNAPVENSRMRVMYEVEVPLWPSARQRVNGNYAALPSLQRRPSKKKR